MEKKLYRSPSVLLVSLILIACICFGLYFVAHPVRFPPISLVTTTDIDKMRDRQVEQPVSSSSGEFLVSRVVDGDTIDVMIDGEKTPVRLIGINAPEKYAGKNPQCFADEALQYIQKRIERQYVSLVADASQENKDIYGRLLRYVMLDDGTNINLELIQQGYAREYTYKVPYQYQREFRAAQGVAKNTLMGLWNQCK